MNTDIPLFEKIKISDFLDESILNASKDLFVIPYFGYSMGAVLNIVYIYYWFKGANLFSLCINIFFFYLIFRIIQVKFLRR